ncbi:hypothetical protein [Pseudomonas psychrophila]|uniref:hypothetical protein n=1 Tax=Pseudomonas psychrophila TaxID=122355 RepID=UPI000381964E|nr:hypothetical protein [Pseudomonas psychrophila]
MKKFSFYMPPAAYVSKPAELIVFFLMGLALAGVVVFTWNGIVDVPPVPKRLVLRSAQVTHPLYVSRGQVDLYLCVSSDGGCYKHRLEMVHKNVARLNLRKGENIWVSLDSDSSNSFVWGIYDDELKLLVGRQQIEWGQRYINGGNYFMAFWFGLCVIGCLYFLVREVWNRYFYRGGS